MLTKTTREVVAGGVTRRITDWTGRFGMTVFDRVADVQYTHKEEFRSLFAARTEATLIGAALVVKYGDAVTYLIQITDENTGEVVWYDDESDTGAGPVNLLRRGEVAAV